MSSNFFDAGDMQRLERERSLDEQRDRIPVEDDRTPEEDGLDFLLGLFLEALQRRQ